MKRKSFICLTVVLIIILSGILCADYLKDNRIQADIDTKFMSDYGNLIIGMLKLQYTNMILKTQDMAIV